MKMYAHIAFKKKKDFLSKSRESWFEDKLYYFYITYSIVFYRSNTNGSVDVKTHIMVLLSIARVKCLYIYTKLFKRVISY